eukprot:COSAG05_NODE_2007_length_3714_cov_6.483084_3_plen_122_part_00
MCVRATQVFFAQVLSNMVDESCGDLVYNPDYYCTTKGWLCIQNFRRVDYSEANSTDSIWMAQHAHCEVDEDLCVSEATWAVADQTHTPQAILTQGSGLGCVGASDMSLQDRLLQTGFTRTY